MWAADNVSPVVVWMQKGSPEAYMLEYLVATRWRCFGRCYRQWNFFELITSHTSCHTLLPE